MISLVAQAAAIRQLVQLGLVANGIEEVASSALACAEGLLESGRYIESLSLIEECQPALVESRPEVDLRFQVLRLRALLYLGRTSEASDCGKSTLERLAGTAESYPTDWAQLRTYSLGCLWRQNGHREAVNGLSAIRRELILRPESLAACSCALELATAFAHSGERETAKAHCLEAWSIARRLESTYWLGMAEFNLGLLARTECDWEVATQHLACAQNHFESLGNGFLRMRCLHIMAIVDWKRGRLEAALSRTEELRSEQMASLLHEQYWYSSLLRSLILNHQGKFSDALKTLREEPDWQVPSKFSRASLLTVEYLGDIDLEQGNAEAALARYTSALTQAMVLVPKGDIVAELRRRIAECHFQLGDAKKALPLAQEALAHCREIRERYDEAATFRVLALALAELGRHDEAKIAFDEGFALFDEFETPYEWGKLWMAYGDWRSAEGSGSYRNDSAALEAYRAACDHFERMGAEYKLGEARGKLEALEARMREDGAEYEPTSGRVRPARRPRLGPELLRRSQWAMDTFGTVTRHAYLLEMLEEIASVAVSDLPVLILGESGTGKELVARGVHQLSGRTGEFLAINCSAVAETMLEGEFFGYMRGAFTNAVADKPGLFEVADRGTVFLDEIGEMSPDLQSKLLRFLETGVLRRVGATRDTHVETRIVAATNRRRAALQAGEGFRSDLYYRLAHAVYELPPLRERGDDVEMLVEHYLEVFNRQNGRTVRLNPAARAQLLRYPWPGNVRELRSVLHKVVVAARADGVITPRDIPALKADAAPATYSAERDAEEKRLILAALEKSRFVKTDAARILRISRTTLVGKMKRLGIEG
jgi:tetratricopeptide (TPR) repeat protein